jgi:hypothetical protein
MEYFYIGTTIEMCNRHDVMQVRFSTRSTSLNKKVISRVSDIGWRQVCGFGKLIQRPPNSCFIKFY